MPQMGVSVSEGTVTKWLKQPGEAIARDEPLLEISTDKVDTEVPSPGEGVLAQVLVAAGGRGGREAVAPAWVQVPAAPVAAGEAGTGEALEPITAMRRGVMEHMRRS